jgi:hypothetical protein
MDPQSLPEEPMDIHTWFSLTYSNYLVLPRTLLQSMPLEWQHRFVAQLHELDAALGHHPQASVYEVTAARECEISELSPEEIALLDVVVVEPDENEETESSYSDSAYYYKGQQVDYDYRVLIPVPDPIPHYNRGRTLLPIRTADEQA